MSIPFFSIIIPTYNRSKYLHDIFRCLENQTFKNFEILICDDGSTDDTKLVLDSYDGTLNIVSIFIDHWGGPALPRNVGIKNSKADWICFLDSDDIWYKDKLLHMYKAIHRKKRSDVFYHFFHLKDNNTSKVIGRYPTPYLTRIFKHLLYSGNSFVCSSVCIRKSKIFEVGTFSENINFVGVEDYDLLLKLSKLKCKFHSVKKVLGEYRLNDDNISANYLRQVDKIKLVLSQYEDKNDIRKMNSLIDYYYGNYFILIKDTCQASLFFMKIVFNKSSFIIKVKSIYKLFQILIVEHV